MFKLFFTITKFPLLVLFLTILGNAKLVNGDEVLYVVRDCRLAPLLHFQTDGSNKKYQHLEQVVRGSVVIATEFRPRTAECPPLWKVMPLDGAASEEVFIQANHVILYRDNLDLLQKYDDQIHGNSRNQELVPPLQVFSNGSLSVIRAWNEANKAVVKTEGLPELKRSPSPYFARAAVLNRVMSYAEALADCHMGNQILSNKNRDPVEVQRYSDIYLEALHGLQDSPVSQVDSESNIEFIVAPLMNDVVKLIRKNQVSRAEVILNRVISLQPAKPKYWYLRAVCRFLGGNLQLAGSDAMIGQYFERRLPKNQRHDVSRGLEHIQGPARLWLESYRNGSAELVRMSESALRQ